MDFPSYSYCNGNVSATDYLEFHFSNSVNCPGIRLIFLFVVDMYENISLKKNDCKCVYPFRTFQYKYENSFVKFRKF